MADKERKQPRQNAVEQARHKEKERMRIAEKALQFAPERLPGGTAVPTTRLASLDVDGYLESVGNSRRNVDSETGSAANRSRAEIVEAKRRDYVRSKLAEYQQSQVLLPERELVKELANAVFMKPWAVKNKRGEKYKLDYLKDQIRKDIEDFRQGKL